jgi:hypothetical protein
MNWPTPFRRHRSHLALRIGGTGIADQVHQCDVFIAIGVK